mmetsp:Transcript_75114/g.125215  ORF Transcript_75114/g.125215 Transcript_75114/m.125215 type:complete len:257 (-) Transcript_75114:748-1518(-)
MRSAASWAWRSLRRRERSASAELIASSVCCNSSCDLPGLTSRSGYAAEVIRERRFAEEFRIDELRDMESRDAESRDETRPVLPEADKYKGVLTVVNGVPSSEAAGTLSTELGGNGTFSVNFSGSSGVRAIWCANGAVRGVAGVGAFCLYGLVCSPSLSSLSSPSLCSSSHCGSPFFRTKLPRLAACSFVVALYTSSGVQAGCLSPSAMTLERRSTSTACTAMAVAFRRSSWSSLSNFAFSDTRRALSSSIASSAIF